MNNLETIAKAVHAACPELLELSFGCVIKSYTHPDYDVCIDEPSEIDGLVGGKYATHGRKNIEIIGHPIQPHHILRALGGVYSIDGVGFVYQMMSTGIWINVRKDTGLTLMYDLTKSLQDQSEEVLQFLSDNLK